MATTEPEVLVLESTWDADDLASRQSVRPFFDAWSLVSGRPVTHRSFHDGNDLRFWLNRFAEAKSGPTVCYIAAHGSGGRLGNPTGPSVNLRASLATVFPLDYVRKQKKGILLGSCNVGSGPRLANYLEGCGPGLGWLVGYSRAIPWMESMLCDLLFLTYYFDGRAHRPKGSEPAEVDAFQRQMTKDPVKAAEWVLGDLELARSMGFSARTRTRGVGDS